MLNPFILIEGIANVHNDQFYKCTEFVKMDEKARFGIVIYYKKENVLSYFNIFYNLDEFNENQFDSINRDDMIFDMLSVKREYNDLIFRTKNSDFNKTLKFMEYYLRPPLCDLKRNVMMNKIGWQFMNIYNYYFCCCVGQDCLMQEIPQKEKYYAYMNIIQLNRDVYNKTDYIFVDFIFEDLSSDDTFPVFEKMKKLDYPVHYITENKNIIKKYCNDTNYCPTIIKITHDVYNDFGDFFERYLTLILKTKSVISCKENKFHFVSYLFYRLEYLTYIGVGHGVCYFKDYLFEPIRLYGNERNNKILVPPSQILIDVPKRYGWKDEDIIKINLPRWDRYIYDDNNVEDNYEGLQISNNSILVMFTWRYNKWRLKKKISTFYHDNITRILENEKLNEALERKNTSLYFSFHRYINDKYKKRYENLIANKSNIYFIEQNDISHCLAKTSLVVSDFSSIIFDLMYRGKPIIIFVPDSNEPNLDLLYTDDYSKLIEDMNRRKYHLENHFNTVEETVNKMIYYINNDFALDFNLKKYYDTFGLKKGNNIDEFIEYLKKLP